MRSWNLAIRIAASCWAFAFAGVHLYWLAGGAVGLPPPIAATRPAPILWATAAAVPLLTIAGLAPLIGPGLTSAALRRLARAGVALVGAFCLSHALPAFASAAADALADRLTVDVYNFYTLALYEPNWLIGGVLFALVWRRWRPPAPAAPRF